MKYLCLIYACEQTLRCMPGPELERILDECHAYQARLREGGHYLAGAALESVETATTLRVRAGRVGIADGPFAQTSEQLAGFYLIDAEGLHEALHLAAAIPAARLGSVEVRPVRSLEATSASARAAAALP
ncbi:YciI family protein [Paracidovorax citrulli]